MSVELALEHLITSNTLQNSSKQIIYLAPSTNLRDEIKKTIQNIPNGHTYLDNDQVKMMTFSEAKDFINSQEKEARQDILFLVDEAQQLKDTDKELVDNLDNVIFFGDMNQVIDQQQSLFNTLDANQNIILQDNSRCPKSVMDMAGIFLDHRDKSAKQQSDQPKQRKGVRANNGDSSTDNSDTNNIKFYDAKFLNSITPKSTEVAFVVFNQDKKNTLESQGKRNVFLINEIGGLEFKQVIIDCTDHELITLLGRNINESSNNAFYNSLYVAVTRSTAEVYLHDSLRNSAIKNKGNAITLLQRIKDDYTSAPTADDSDFIECSTDNEWLELAKNYLIKGLYDQANNILKKYNYDKVDVVQSYNNGLSIELPRDLEDHQKEFAALYAIRIAQSSEDRLAGDFAMSFIKKQKEVEDPEYLWKFANICSGKISELKYKKANLYASSYLACYDFQITNGKSHEYADKHADVYATQIANGENHESDGASEDINYENDTTYTVSFMKADTDYDRAVSSIWQELYDKCISSYKMRLI